MAKKGKAKISKVKRNNQTTNKMKKQGTLRLQRHKAKVQKQKPQAVSQPEYSSESDSTSGDEWGDMLDEEEQKYMMNQMAKNPKLLSSVPEKDESSAKPIKKRKRTQDKPKPEINQDSGADTDSTLSDSDVEGKYEKEQSERPVKKMRPLLPIKTKEGVVAMEEECEDTESESEDKQPMEPKPKRADSDQDSDSGMEGITEDEEKEVTPAEGDDGVVSTVQLMAARRDTLMKEKIRIGALCSSLLETPERKLKNLFPILYLMEETLKDGTPNLHSVRKLATLSAYEVFKDILPEYMIRHQDYSNVKLKKDTLALYKYEKELLEFYKRYLQRLEKATSVLRQKKGDTRKMDDASISLALVSLRAMCGLLSAKPQFNYSVNIAQSVIPLLGSARPDARDIVTGSCVQVFKDDKRGDITLTIVRLINQLVKKRGARLPPSALDCLLSLKLKDIELDAEADIKHKQKMEEKKKKRIINLSKKEKKRAKKLREVERELLETEAQESEAARRRVMTEVTQTVFHIYFRVLKNEPHSKLLAAVLDGLTKFTHVINLEYYSELVGILTALMGDANVRPRERLQCARAALGVLAGAGDSLNVDPARLHLYLYDNMLSVHCASQFEDARVVVEGLLQVCARARRVSAEVLQAFAKRLGSWALQLSPHGALAALATIRLLAQQSKPVESLYELSDESVGSGRYDPYCPSPAHCRAAAAALAELAALARHYHPAVRELARAGPSAAPPGLDKLSPTQLLQQYDGSQLTFKPAVPPPPRTPPPQRAPRAAHLWSQPALRDYCAQVELTVDAQVDFTTLYTNR